MNIAKTKMNSTENIDHSQSYVVYDDECLSQTCKINVDYNSMPEEYILSDSKENDIDPKETRIPKTSFQAANKRNPNKSDVKDLYDDENYCLARSYSVSNNEVKHIEEKSHYCNRKVLAICLVVVVILLFCVTGGLVGALFIPPSKLL